MDLDERLKEETETMEAFYNGAPMLQKLADWAYVNANHREVLQHISLFEKAYEQLIGLHAIGKLSAGGGDFSAENLERVKRISRLIQPGLDSSETLESAQEIHSLAERCLEALTGRHTSSSGRQA
jgi:hypothetical protein